MKNIALIILAISMMTISCKNNLITNITYPLPKEWKFHTGDNPEFSRKDFNDSTWKNIKADTFWEVQGYPSYDGIAWYRTHLVLPSSLKKNNEQLNAVQLFLGRIDDADETFLNGKKIGETEGWDADRSYLIPFSLIQWDKENVIAIRVNDFGGNGGIYGNHHFVGDVRLSDLLVLVTKDRPMEFISANTKFKRTLLFHFKTPVSKIEGALHIKVYETKNRIIVFKKEVHLSVGSKADTSFSFSLEIKNPGSYKIEYVFKANESSDSITCNTLMAYASTTRLHEQLEYPVVKLTAHDKSIPFDLEDIQFGGYLNDRLNANLTQRLLKIDETGILECYYNRPGKQTWVGEYAGKYLHAASRVWRSTKNAQLKTQMDRIVDILIACQNEDGYLGTYLPANYWTEWDVWAHKYNLLGLLSYYATTGYKPALEASIKMGDLLCRTFGEQMGQRSIIDMSPHMGMASTSVLEPMTYLYRYTGNKKYLDFCKYIIRSYDFKNGPKIISTLTSIGKVDKTADAKAYEMMSNLTGVVKLYQLTGNESLLKAAETAWNDISTHKLYITGTASEGECFKEDYILPAGNDAHMGEGCVTVTWLQFSQAMYDLTGEPKYISEIEKTIYNHLFAAENPETGCVSYYTALQGKKPYRCNIDGHCCLASLPRGIAAIPELAITKNTDNGLNINLYSTEELTANIFARDGKAVGIECTVESNFLADGGATITLNPQSGKKFRVSLHVPSWCKYYSATVNGKRIIGIPGQYLSLEQFWDKHTVIHVSFDMPLQLLEGGKSYPGYLAIKYGTQVLAVDQALNPQIKDMDKIMLVAPQLLPASKSILPKGWVGSQVYNTKAWYEGKQIELSWVPFADAGQTGGDIRVWIKRK